MDVDSSRPRPVWLTVAFLLTAVGATGSGYLLWRHFASSPAEFDVCRRVFGSDCDTALRSAWATFLGIPLAGWGLVHFSVVVTLLLLTLLIGDGFRSEGIVAVVIASSAATAVGAALTFLMLADYAPFCPLCIGVHAVNVLLVPVGIAASGRTPGALITSLWHGVAWVFGSKVADPALARWKMTGLFTAALVGVASYQWVQIQVDRGTAKPSLDQAIAEFEASPVREFQGDDAAPRLGPAESKVRLVVFSDFECGACRGFALALRHLQVDHPEVQVVFLHFPLSSSCNSAVKADLHPGSCLAAVAAEAAHRQGRFWEFHNAVLATPGKIDDATLVKLAKDVGLSVDRFNSDRRDAAATSKVKADAEFGARLAIDGTPTVFLNGRLLNATGMSFLRDLVKHELGKTT